MTTADGGDAARRWAACIVAIACEGDEKAFETLFVHFAPRVKAYLMRLGGGAAAAEELMQETMVQVWRKAAQFDPAKSSAATWIFAIARNKRIDAFRRGRHPEFDPADPALVPSQEIAPDRALETGQDANRLMRALARLNPNEQSVLMLAYFEDKSQSMIAEDLKIPLGTVKSRMRLAFAKLRVALAEPPGDPP